MYSETCMNRSCRHVWSRLFSIYFSIYIVNHEILLHKLKLHGINCTCLERFKCYLSNRNHCIVYHIYDNIKKFVYLDILRGVPQGSILVLLLFLIYVNDLFKCLEKLNPVMSADDINLFLPGMTFSLIWTVNFPKYLSGLKQINYR